MSKLYINDLEKIKEGKLVRLNFKEKNYSENEITLLRLSSQINDLRQIRSEILKQFKNDTTEVLDRLKGDRIDNNINVSFDPKLLFLSNYLFLTIPTSLGDTNCLLTSEGLENAVIETNELVEKVKAILPIIKKLYNVKNNTNILDNAFYENTKLYNEDYEHVLSVNGDGIVLPFRAYFDLDNEKLQDLLAYYYTNWDQILRNIIVSDTDELSKYKNNISKEKILNYYHKGE